VTRLLALGAAALLACATGRPPDRPGAAPDDAAAQYRAAERLYAEGRTAEARSLLDALAARGDLGPVERTRALTQRGVIELEDGELDRAERSLQLALSTAESDRYYPAKARFYLGEVSRSRFEAVQLDPSQADGDALASRLEQKSALLLAAQDRYLMTIAGGGDATWAVAAGARVGELYEELHRELLDAPLPPGLDDEGAAAYREALRERLRVLVAKAIQAYQETLAVARRAGVESDFVPRVEAGLERMRRVLDESEPGSDGG
jgi:tetratricopeptide (TPR) repeat protein